MSVTMMFITSNVETSVSGFIRAKTLLAMLMAEVANKDLPKCADPVEILALTIRDLRRTAATGMAELRFSPHLVETVPNHRVGTRRDVLGPTRDGDVVYLICHRHYVNAPRSVEVDYDAIRGLAAYGPFLTASIVIDLPLSLIHI